MVVLLHCPPPQHSLLQLQLVVLRVPALVAAALLRSHAHSLLLLELLELGRSPPEHSLLQLQLVVLRVLVLVAAVPLRSHVQPPQHPLLLLLELMAVLLELGHAPSQRPLLQLQLMVLGVVVLAMVLLQQLLLSYAQPQHPLQELGVVLLRVMHTPPSAPSPSLSAPASPAHVWHIGAVGKPLHHHHHRVCPPQSSHLTS